MLNSSILSIDKILSGTNSPGQSGPWSDGNERLLSPSIKLPHYWSFIIRLFNVISSTLVGGGITPL